MLAGRDTRRGLQASGPSVFQLSQDAFPTCNLSLSPKIAFGEGVLFASEFGLVDEFANRVLSSAPDSTNPVNIGFSAKQQAVWLHQPEVARSVRHATEEDRTQPSTQKTRRQND